MPNLLNGLVNGWVKVNSKHVIFPREDGHHHRRERRDSNASSLDDSSSRVLDRSRGKSNRKYSHQTVTTVSTSQSTANMDPEALAIKKFNSKRQNKRRLQRTISHSDLLREMANGGESKTTKSSDRTSTRDASNSRTASYDSNKTGNRTNDESMRLVAGFFGSDVADEKRRNDGESSAARHPATTSSNRSQNGPVTTGKYLNEAMFVQQLERSKAGRRSNASSMAGSSSASASERSPVLEYNKRPFVDAASAPHHEQEYRSRGESRGTHYDSSVLAKNDAAERKNRHSHSAAAAHGDTNHAHSQCSGCNEKESQLLAAYDDIRYLRDVSLRKEYSHAPSKRKSGIKHELTTLADASKRLTEVTDRHRRQIEQMTRETVSCLCRCCHVECIIVPYLKANTLIARSP